MISIVESFPFIFAYWLLFKGVQEGIGLRGKNASVFLLSSKFRNSRQPIMDMKVIQEL